MKRMYNKNQKIKDRLFYWLVLAVPLLQVFLFFVCVNANSILLSVKSYTKIEGSELYEYTFVGLENYIQVIKDFLTLPTHKTMIENSLILFATNFLFGVCTSILFSYYIYKKRPFSGFYRAVLFLPQIISSVVLVIIFKYMADGYIPGIVTQLTGNSFDGLLSSLDTRFITILVYSILVGYGSSVLLFSGAMSSINESTIEAGKIDGANTLQEFIHIILPGIWPTFVTLSVVSLSQLFVNQMNLYTIYSTTADYSIQTVGYYLYSKTVGASYVDYPYLSAMGVLLTLIIFPLTLLLRKLMTKFGPQLD